jgi:hypothetical protein
LFFQTLLGSNITAESRGQPEVKDPDLCKVDEVGLTSLAPGGGHGIIRKLFDRGVVSGRSEMMR